MATVAEIKRRTLEEIGRLRLGQSFQTQDNTFMQSMYDETYAELKELGLATWASTGTIPAELAPHLINIMALKASSVYGVSDSRYQRILAGASVAPGAMRQLTTPQYESMEEPVDY